MIENNNNNNNNNNKCRQSRCRVFVLNSPQLSRAIYNMVQTLDFGHIEKYEVISFYQTNTIEEKESTKRTF